MSKKLLLIVPVLALIGCTSLTTQQREEVKTAQQQAVKTLNAFAEAVAADDVPAAMEQVSTGVPAGRKGTLTTQVRRATWLSAYTGYSLAAEEAVMDIDEDAWLSGNVRRTLVASNSRGNSFEDTFELGKTDAGWKLTDFKLNKPIQGEDVDLPEEHRKVVAEKISKVINQMKAGDYAYIFTSLPERARLRQPKYSWWQSLIGSVPQPISIYSDLLQFDSLDVHRWPDPSTELPAAYVSTNAVMVIYTIPYSWPERGIMDDQLQMETLMARQKGEWKMLLLRFYGEGIPGSEE